VSVRKVDLSTELQILSYYQQRQGATVATPGPGLEGAAEEVALA